MLLLFSFFLLLWVFFLILFAALFRVLAGTHIEMFLKYFTEILDVTESRHLGYFGDGVLSGL